MILTPLIELMAKIKDRLTVVAKTLPDEMRDGADVPSSARTDDAGTQKVKHAKDQAREGSEATTPRPVPRIDWELPVRSSSRRAQCHPTSKAKSKISKKPDTPLCAGITISGARCKHVLPWHKSTTLAFCHIHEDQRYTYTQCYGILHNTNIRCLKRVPRDVHRFGFCSAHQDQIYRLPNFLTAPGIPTEVVDLIVENLPSQDRVALALASKACLKVVMAWSHGREVKKLKASRNPILYISPELIDNHIRYTGQIAYHQIVPGSQAYVARSVRSLPTPIPGTTGRTRLLRSMPTTSPRVHGHGCGRFVSCFSENYLQTVMKNHPHLFVTDASRPGNCMLGCGPLDLVTDMDHDIIVSQPPNWDDLSNNRYSRAQLDAKLRRRYLCKMCALKSDIVMRMSWCYQCDGQQSPTIIARAFWKIVGTQSESYTKREDSLEA